MISKILKTPEPYRPDLLPSNRFCHGAITVIRDFVWAELYHDQPIGQPPFVEVVCKPERKFFTGELFGYSHDTSGLVGFASPTLEFLSEEDAIVLRAEIIPMLTFEAAEALGYSARYLAKLRNLGQGPKFWRVAEDQEIYEVWYDRKDVDAYALERKSRAERRGGRRD